MRKLGVVLTLLLAAGVMLLPAAGAQAASKNRGAVLVKSGGGRSGGGSDLTNVNGTLYFAGKDRRHGIELWRSDGTRRGTRMVKDVAPGRYSSNPGEITAVGKTLYFTARDGIHGLALWRSNGTARGTRIVRGIVPAPASWDSQLTNVGGTLFFVASANAQPGAPIGLWRSDGTAEGTTMVKEFKTIGYPTAVGRTLYFAGDDGTDVGLWRSDGTAAGTVLVKDVQAAGICNSYGVCNLANVSGTLFFDAGQGTNYGLWRSDGTEAGTTLVKEGLIPTELTAVGSSLYFATIDYNDSWLWRSNGTETGTVPVTSVGVSPQGDGPWPQITNAGGTIYFVRNGPGWPLMRTDGTARGTKALRSNLNPDLLTAAERTLYFAGTDERHGQELWRSDGTRRGTRMVRDIRRGREGSNIGELTAVGKTLFFNASTSASVFSRGLWRAGPATCKARKKKCKSG